MSATRSLTDLEIELVLQRLNDQRWSRERAMFLLAIHAGLSLAEILGLRVGDILRVEGKLVSIRIRRTPTRLPVAVQDQHGLLVQNVIHPI